MNNTAPNPSARSWALMLTVSEFDQVFTVLVTWVAVQFGQVVGLAAIGPDQAMRAVSAALVRRRAILTFHPHEAIVKPWPDWWVQLRNFGEYGSDERFQMMAAMEGSWRFTYTRITDKAVQLIALPASAYDPGSDAKPIIVMAPPGKDPDDAIWARLQQESLPLLSQWQKPILEALKAGRERVRLRPITSLAAPEHPAPTLWQLEGFSEQSWEQFVQRLMQSHQLILPDGIGANGPMPDAQMTQDTYLTGWASALGQQLESVVVPRVTAGSGVPASWSVLKRQPYPAQADVIRAVAQTCQASRVAYMIGEQGTGKTLMGSVAIWHLMTELKGRQGFRAILMVPDHLLAKWQREIDATIPHAVVRVLLSWKDVLALRQERGTRPTQPTFYLIGRDRAKLSYYSRPVAQWDTTSAMGRKGQGVWRCPDCGAVLMDHDTDLLWTREVFKAPRLKNRWCPECHGTANHPSTIRRRKPASGQGLLWSADGTRLRRMSPAWLMGRYLKGFFDVAFFDELHELKGETAQGDALGAIARMARYTIGATGTLNGGYASHQHFLGFRLHPQTMTADGLVYRWASQTIRRYGRVEVIRDVDDGSAGVMTHRSVTRERSKELPGVSPEFFAQHLAARAAFIELADLGAGVLPPYQETIDWVQPTPEQKTAIDYTVGCLRDAAIDALHQGRRHLLGKLVTFSLTYPDMPWADPIVDPDTGKIVVDPPCLPSDQLYPKDYRLLTHIMAAVDGRKERAWVYTAFSGTQLERLRSIIEDHGYRVAVMTTQVPRHEREAWVDQRVKEGVQVIISHPQIVETGLDLLDFPTMVWFATGYSLFRLRQASRRAWRIGQSTPCRVVFLAYEHTMQEAALTLMGRKLEAALALEGRLSLEGLQALGSSDSANDLARVLANGLPEGTDASAIWQATPAELLQAPQMTDQEVVTVPDAVVVSSSGSALITVVRADRKRNRHGTQQVSQEQLAWAF